MGMCNNPLDGLSRKVRTSMSMAGIGWLLADAHVWSRVCMYVRVICEGCICMFCVYVYVHVVGGEVDLRPSMSEDYPPYAQEG